MELLAQLGVNWHMLIAQAVNFLIILCVLTLLVYKPLLRLIDERSARIRSAMEQAEKTEEEMRKLEEYRMERMKKIDEEYGAMLAEAQRKAGKMHEQLIKNAKREAAEIVEKGRIELMRERSLAIRAVRMELGKAVIELSEKLLKRRFSESDQKKELGLISDSMPNLLK